MAKLSGTHPLVTAALNPPEMAPFDWFNIDMTQARHPIGLPMCPELAATSRGPVWLWEIRSNKGNAVDHKRGDSQEAAVAHQMRVDDYAARVARDETLFEGDDDAAEVAVLEYDDTPPDEWERFWGGESPTEKQAHYRGG